ncbi:hypothetical protein, partial [Deinococcus marmoris]|uniref:hypothetical protein n=1 Tax=Deinococcus marmoris TaxID=249408 RepID=UPI001C37B2CF
SHKICQAASCKMSVKLSEMKSLLIESEKGHKAFHDAYNKVKSPYYLSNMSETEEESYYMMSDGVNSSLDGSIKLRDGLIQVINSFREAQDLPPLDGGLSSLN